MTRATLSSQNFRKFTFLETCFYQVNLDNVQNSMEFFVLSERAEMKNCLHVLYCPLKQQKAQARQGARYIPVQSGL